MVRVELLPDFLKEAGEGTDYLTILPSPRTQAPLDCRATEGWGG